MKTKFKRRQYPVVFRDRQYRLLAMVLFYSFSLVVILFVFLFLPDFFLMQDETASLVLRGQAADRVLMLHARLWPAILAAICLIGLHSFRLFLLFIGPLKRLRWAFESMKTGDLTIQVVLRDGDFLIEEGDSLNETIEALAKKVKKAKSAAGTSRDALASLGADIQKLPPDYSSCLTENLQVVQSSLAEEWRCLNYFRTPGKKMPREETAD